MAEVSIHCDIKAKLKSFIDEKKIPHIIFHGPSGCGKRHVLRFFIESIYKNPDSIKKYVMYINCAHSKGIRFIRDELKFFAKTNIHLQHGNVFKSIILFNASKLTTDAQSALRRCIEQFSHTTRFFIIVDNENKVLKPILSRFCNMFIPIPHIDGNKMSLHSYKRRQFVKNFTELTGKRWKWLEKQLSRKQKYNSSTKCMDFAEKLYEKGYSGLDIMQVIEKSMDIPKRRKYELLIYFDRVRREFRNEKLLIAFMVDIAFMRPELSLENIEEM